MSIIASRHLYASLTFETRFQNELEKKENPKYLPAKTKNPKIRVIIQVHLTSNYLENYQMLSPYFLDYQFLKPIIEL